MNQEGKKRNKKYCWNTKGGKKKKKEGVKCWECGRAGLRPRGGDGMGEWEWSKAARRHISSFFILFFFFKSLTPPHHQALFFSFSFSDWDMQGHQKAANRSLNHCEQPWQTCREGMFVTPESGLQEEKLDRVLRLPIFEKKGTTLTPVCYALC